MNAPSRVTGRATYRTSRALAAAIVGAVSLSCSSAPPASAPTATPSPEALAAASETRPAPAFHVPDGRLPAIAPISTYGEDGERIDPIESLQALLDAGGVSFSHDSVTGYLPSLLAALDIPLSSQTLIFSRTSLQTLAIAPWAPRAIYFNDDIYVGYVQDSPILEVASIDPDAGSVFYTMSQSEETGPQFNREGTLCLQCHESPVTERVPGVLVRSTLTDRMGSMVTVLHEGPQTDRTPMSERFAGWYVTGTHEGSGHAGNVRAPETHDEIQNISRYLETFDLTAGNDVTRLDDFFDTSLYLSPHSDFVALLVLTHQTRVHNLIAAANLLSIQALREQDAVLLTTGQEAPESGLLPATEIKIDGAVDRLVREMFFSREAPLGGRVTGTSGFAEEFVALGPRDRQGRSLRDFNLETRLFEYPLSFLIYTEAFDALPELVKRRVYGRLDGVLDGTDASGDFEHLTEAQRRAIREILLETKPDFVEAVGG